MIVSQESFVMLFHKPLIFNTGTFQVWKNKTNLKQNNYLLR